jgi:hypothetical protein
MPSPISIPASLLLLAALCANDALAAISRDGDSCHLDSAKVTLCFDLRDDSHPTAGLMLNIGAVDNAHHLIYLPFETSAPVPDRSILSSWASYPDMTLIAFSTVSGGPHAIAFTPTYDGSQSALDDRGSRSSIVFVKSGLERDFIYRSRDASNDDFLQRLKDVAVDPVDMLGVMRPKDARGLEVSNGRIEEPQATTVVGGTRFYAALDENHKATRLEVRYEIPATPLVTLLLTDLAKLAAAFSAPLVTILFFSVKENLRPRARKWILIALLLLQLGIAAVLGFLAWTVRNDTSSAALADWMIVFVTAAASALPLWLQRKRAGDSLAVRP